MTLTETQIEELRTAAREVIFEDVRQDENYMWDVVDHYVSLIPIEELADRITTDKDFLKLYLDFDPETGYPWIEENE
jgi:hypothetical protein